MMNEIERIELLVESAKKAQSEIENYSQKQIDDTCLSVGWQTYKDDNVRQLASIAVKETGMGNYEDKITKHKVKVFGVCKDIIGAKSTGVIETNNSTGIVKYGKPVGVVGAVTPCTNPTATLASNAVSILKGKNAMIFAPHPRAIESCRLICKFMKKGLSIVGAPDNLIQYIDNPSISLTQELMRQVDLVVATGGRALVKAAYSSGTPAFGVGPGNAVTIIAEDADINTSAEKITLSKIFDNSTSCSSDNSVIVHNKVYRQFLDTLCKKNGGYLCSEIEKDKLEKWVWPDKEEKKLNPKITAKSAIEIADGAGLTVSKATKMLLIEGNHPGKELFSGEKLSPILTIWKYNNINHALDILTALLEYTGKGHSCGIHTLNSDYIDKVASTMNVSRLIVNQAHGPAAGGSVNNGMPSTTTLGCGTWGGNITTENIHWKHFINVTWVSHEIQTSILSEADVFGKISKRSS